MKIKLLGLVAYLVVSAVVYPAYSDTIVNFVYSDGSYTIGGAAYQSPPVSFPSEIYYPGSADTQLSAINSSGQIVGTYDSGCGCVGASNGFLYNGGTYSTFNFGTAWTIPTNINNASQIAGIYDAGFGGFQGFLYSGGQFTTVDVAGSLQTTIGVNDLNALGEVVGQYVSRISPTTTATYSGVFLYTNRAYTILDPTGFASGSDYINVTGINDAGQIYGYYDIPSTPLPPTWTMMLTGLAGFGLIAYRQKRIAAAIAAA